MSEFREDLVTGEWIISAPERAKRPHEIFEKLPKRKPSPKNGCPFEDLEATGNWPPILAWPNEKDRRIVILPNKFPALTHNPVCSLVTKDGPSESRSGVGEHDLVLTKRHNVTLGNLPPEEMAQLLILMQKRYRVLAKDECLRYPVGFHNWGASVGASLYHPHLQILTLPVIPKRILHSLAGSERYFRKHKRCAHCDLLAYERKRKKRVIFENRNAVAVCPFASHREFEMIVFPKKHFSNFEQTPEKVIRDFAEILQKTLRAIRIRLHDPDFNFYIHTAPFRDEAAKHYHWHVEILPNLPPPPGGFELGSGVEINTVDPEKAASILLGK